MVLKPQPIFAAVESLRSAESRVILLGPAGKKFNQSMAKRLAGEKHLILICGHYEGIDHRVVEHLADEEISIGDYVLSGGELAAMVVIDAVTRQLPGVLGHESSAIEDSFADGLLDCPHYTRPEVYEGKSVPAVLLSGNHEAIRRWRLKQALGRTYERRPELLQGRAMPAEEQTLLAEYLRERELSTERQL